jgi:hypothetical protein
VDLDSSIAKRAETALFAIDGSIHRGGDSNPRAPTSDMERKHGKDRRRTHLHP